MTIKAIKERVEFESLINGGVGQLHHFAKDVKKADAPVDSYSAGDGAQKLKSIEKTAGYADFRMPMFRSPLARRG